MAKTAYWLCIVIITVSSTGVITSDADEFVAAVFEYKFFNALIPSVVVPKSEAVKLMMKNIDVYERQVLIAKEQVDHIVILKVLSRSIKKSCHIIFKRCFLFREPK